MALLYEGHAGFSLPRDVKRGKLSKDAKSGRARRRTQGWCSLPNVFLSPNPKLYGIAVKELSYHIMGIW